MTSMTHKDALPTEPGTGGFGVSNHYKKGLKLALYQSKPQQVEALQWTGDNLAGVLDFGGGSVAASLTPDRLPLNLLAGKDGAQEWVPVPIGHWLVQQAVHDAEHRVKAIHEVANNNGDLFWLRQVFVDMNAAGKIRDRELADLQRRIDYLTGATAFLEAE